MYSANRKLFQKHLAQTSDAPLMLEFEKAEGSYLITGSGKKYIDLISGIAVSNIGHARTEVAEAVAGQMKNYSHLMVYGEYVQSPQIELATHLTSLLPKNLQSVYFTNSGSEATEGAIKLCRRYTARNKIIAFSNSYHGSTTGALALMSSKYFRAPFEPLLPDVHHYTFNEMDAVNAIDESTAAVVMEVIQAEAGVIPGEHAFLQAIRKKCSASGCLLVFDECQTALGRTGQMFAFEKYKVTPDVLLLAKALGGGLPLGAFISSPEVMRCLSFNPVLGHITTFGGNPVCCAAALAAIRYLQKHVSMEEVTKKGSYLMQAITNVGIVQKRGSGLMIAVEFESSAVCRKVIQLCIASGVITDWFLFAENCMRIAPPLTISYAEIDEAISVINKSIEQCAR